MKESSSGAKFSLVLIALAALCSCAVAQEDAADYWTKKGDGLTLNNSFQEALAAYENAIQIDPENETTWLSKALVHQILSKQANKEALNLAEKKLENNSQDARAWQARGAALAGLGREDEAIQSFENATEIYNLEIQNDPENATAWWFKAENLGNLGKQQEALPAYEKVIELNGSRKVDAWFAKASIFMTLGRHNESLAAYEEVIEQDPKYVLAWMGKGYLLTALGRDSEAEDAFAKASELGYEVQPALSLAITNVTSVGEDEFIEMANDGNETQSFENLILTIDENESVVLPDFILEPGQRIRVHLGEGESNETDIFLNSDLALDDVAGNLILKDSAGGLEKFAAYWTPGCDPDQDQGAGV